MIGKFSDTQKLKDQKTDEHEDSDIEVENSDAERDSDVEDNSENEDNSKNEDNSEDEVFSDDGRQAEPADEMMEENEIKRSKKYGKKLQ